MDKDISKAAALLGRKGRAVNSPAQQDAARANGAKGGRPKMRRVLVKGRYGDGESVEIILRDGRTATRGQYESALRRLGRHSPIGDGLVLVDKDQSEIPVYDGDQPWAMLS